MDYCKDATYVYDCNIILCISGDSIFNLTDAKLYERPHTKFQDPVSTYVYITYVASTTYCIMYNYQHLCSVHLKLN